MNNKLIKFRAWDGEIMLNRTLFDRNWYTKDNKCARVAMPKDVRILNVMQYIGLNDSNGVEIYESDIFDWIGIIEVVTIDYHHGIRSKYGKDDFCKFYCDGKVIGNIYENPDQVIAINSDK